MPAAADPGRGIRRTEVIAALSLATDLAMGQPLEFALKSCVLGMRLGEALGLSPQEMAEVHCHSLLRYIGCNAETYSLVALFGDEIALRQDFARIDMGRAPEVLGVVLRHLRRANAGAPPLDLAWALMRGLATSQAVAAANIAGHCEVAERLAARLGFDSGVIRNLGQIYERWDGKGLPQGLRGEAIAPAVRVVTLAQDAIVLREAHGDEAAIAVVRRRRGTAYDPRMADRFCNHAADLLSGLDGMASWDAVLALEPGARPELSEQAFDEACLAVADFVDIKSPYALGHSRVVGELAAEAARRCRLPEADAVALRRAGYLHDIGQVGITTRIWVKPGPLTDSEREQVRLHPYYAERVLAKSAPLARLGAIAGAHHERLDGSGYHRGVRGAVLSPAARILAAAEVYQAMTEPRPHRSAHSIDAAAATLQREARAGRLDSDAVAAVLNAAGHRVSASPRALVADLTAREIEVLRLIARGKSMKEIARELGISPKTVDNHIQHLYLKIGARTRAGATLYAIEHGLAGAEAE
jgi:HD-GYP domain-containing protein (c-di-GMP phosphodiesterase class II)